MTEKKSELDRLFDVRKEVEGEVKEVVSFVGSLKRAFFSNCSTCGDTGILPNSPKGHPLFCSCAAGLEACEREEKKELEAPARPRELPRGRK